MQGLGEATGFPDASWDLVAYNFVIHECPQQAIRDFVTESRRILKPGGVLCFVDNNPRWVQRRYSPWV
jgi:ubiquinone/menaquinone biosynthesis C-methylase UbiE